MQLDIWEKEYKVRKNLPSTKSSHASRALTTFLLEVTNLNKSLAVDMGSGNGRNSIYLAEYGFEKVVGVELSPTAIELAYDAVSETAVQDKVEFIEQNLGSPIHLPDNSVDLIIDMMTMHSLSKEEREIYAKEVMRMLKPDGHLVFYTIAAESEEAQDLIKKSPGNELNSYTFKVEEDTVFEKAFST
jgi:SAM-dependent methyltransferase